MESSSATAKQQQQQQPAAAKSASDAPLDLRWQPLRHSPGYQGALDATQLPALKQVFDSFHAKSFAKCASYDECVHAVVKKATQERHAARLEAQGKFSPFWAIDLSKMSQNLVEWHEQIPMVRPYFAIKANPNVALLHVAEALDCGFDCASRSELHLAIEVLKHGLILREKFNKSGEKHDLREFHKSRRFLPRFSHENHDEALMKSDNHYEIDESVLRREISQRIIFTHSIKEIAHILYARQAGVRMTVIDNLEETKKIAKFWPEAQCLLRIVADDTHAESHFSKKFGATFKQARQIIREAKQHSLPLIGVSFHIGSNSREPASFARSIADARRIFEYAKKIGNYDMYLVDIGGGWPATVEAGKYENEYRPSFAEFAAAAREALKNSFGDMQHVQFAAEPGRYLVSETHTLVAQVFGKRMTQDDAWEEPLDWPGAEKDVRRDEQESKMQNSWRRLDKFQYYVNDGVYGGLSKEIFEQPFKPEVRYITADTHDNNDVKYPSTLYGPTCDSIDVIVEGCPLPELQIADWLYFMHCGAYTTASSTHFNGFSDDRLMYWYRQQK